MGKHGWSSQKPQIEMSQEDTLIWESQNLQQGPIFYPLPEGEAVWLPMMNFTAILYFHLSFNLKGCL